MQFFERALLAGGCVFHGARASLSLLSSFTPQVWGDMGTHALSRPNLGTGIDPVVADPTGQDSDKKAHNLIWWAVLEFQDVMKLQEIRRITGKR